MQDRPYRRASSKAAKTKQCECGETFRPYNSTQKYCSPRCSATKVERACATCAKPFVVDRAYSERTRRGLYCSRRCANRAQGTPGLRAQCRACGKAIPPGPPSKRRQSCGDPDCLSALKAEAKRGNRNPNYLGERAGSIRWRTGSQSRCVVCGSSSRLQLHHVAYEQHVRKAHGDPWNPDNSLQLCNGCHCRHHAAPAWKLPVSYLRDENYAFLRDLLGLAAFDYLGRYYHDDGDERMDALLEEADRVTGIELARVRLAPLAYRERAA